MLGCVDVVVDVVFIGVVCLVSNNQKHVFSINQKIRTK